MKHLKRIPALLLLLVLCLSVIACAGDGNSTEGSNTGGEEGRPTLERPKEMAGKEFVIIHHYDDTQPFGYAADSRMALQALKRIDEVEKLYGCTLRFSTVPYNDNFANAIQQLRYEPNAGDLIFAVNNANLRRCVPLSTNKGASVLVSLLQYDDILDFWNVEKGGNIVAKETMMSGEDFYGVTPALWINYLPLTNYQLVYNRDMLPNFDRPDLQEYWENGTWTRDVMMDVILACNDPAASTPVYGISAQNDHMVKASFLAAGCTVVMNVEIDSNGEVTWTQGWLTTEAEEALTWLRQNMTQNSYAFNGGKTVSSWKSYEHFLAEETPLCLTRPSFLFDNIAVDAEFNYGLMTWAGPDPNFISGYYENVCSVAIPVFAQNPEWSAFLMVDLFEGLEDAPTYDSLISYYRNNYLETDLDLEILMKTNGQNIDYSYWPNNCDQVNGSIAAYFLQSSVAACIQSFAHNDDANIEAWILPNRVALQKYKEEGKY